MKFAVVGLGSMGKRRIRCLQANGERDIVAVDLRDDRRAEAEQKYGVRTSTDLAAVLPDVDALLVSVPGYMHMRFCLEAARAGKHWFCEVPLSINLDGIDELTQLTQQSQLVGAPGCQLLFHPLAQSMRDWRNGRSLLHASYSLGTYLPEWHSYEDYRSFYASDKSKGGGNIDVIAQEMTWLRWLADAPIQAVTARTGKTGSLELAEGTPDHQDMIVEFESGLTMSMHFDINDRTHERWLRLAAEDGTAKWSTLDKHADYYEAAASQWRKDALPDNFDYEQCYIAEVGNFVRCIREKDTWPIAIDWAQQIVRLLMAIDQSAADGRTVKLSEVGS